MLYNLVMLSGTIESSDIEYIELQPGKHLALFKLKFYTAKQAGTITVATYDNVTDYVKKSLQKGSEILIKGNLNQYNGEIQIIANSIDTFDLSGKVVSSVKKESRKGWSDTDTPGKASIAEHPADESFDDLRERLAKLEKMLSDAGKSHDT
ncbi:MAG: hypothetical protein ABSC55_14460 [Syntrophorhabdales bacterium]|jgi:RecG-like helicase